MATLSVQEAMGFKVDREAVATLVLPQLWSMSIGPLLNVDQFHRFMSVIQRLGERVEKEHDQFLRDSQRIEDRSAFAVDSSSTQNFTSTVNFENLVGRTSATTIKADTMTENKLWEDDVWGSIFNDTPSKNFTPITSSAAGSSHVRSDSGWETSQTTLRTSSRTLPPPLPPPSNLRRSDLVKSELPTSTNQPPPQPVLTARPNYNISLSAQPTTNVHTTTSTSNNQFASTSSSVMPLMPPTMTNLLTPSKPAQTSNPTSTKKLSKADWGDFDPLA